MKSTMISRYTSTLAELTKAASDPDTAEVDGDILPGADGELLRAVISTVGPSAAEVERCLDSLGHQLAQMDNKVWLAGTSLRQRWSSPGRGDGVLSKVEQEAFVHGRQGDLRSAFVKALEAFAQGRSELAHLEGDGANAPSYSALALRLAHASETRRRAAREAKQALAREAFQIQKVCESEFMQSLRDHLRDRFGRDADDKGQPYIGKAFRLSDKGLWFEPEGHFEGVYVSSIGLCTLKEYYRGPESSKRNVRPLMPQEVAALGLHAKEIAAKLEAVAEVLLEPSFEEPRVNDREARKRLGLESIYSSQPL